MQLVVGCTFFVSSVVFVDFLINSSFKKMTLTIELHCVIFYIVLKNGTITIKNNKCKGINTQCDV